MSIMPRMSKIPRVYSYSKFSSLYKALDSFRNNTINNSIYNPYEFCSNNIVIQKYKLNDMNVVRVWKSNYVLSYRLEDFKYSNFIGGIDYRVNKDNDNIKIEYLSINDIEYAKLMNCTDNLSAQMTRLVRKSFIKFTENIAKENNITKIVIDVHENLKRFDKEFLPEGFINTKRKCADNSYWVEAEKTI